jgi:tetratricopeptide (TPR) repeat protein
MTRALFLLLFLFAPLAWAQTADELLADGTKAYEAGRYDEAVAAFGKAYTLDPNPKTLFAWAQAERKGGNCPAAVKLFKRYLETNPPERSAQVAKGIVAECALAEPEPKPAPDPVTADPDTKPTPAPVVRDTGTRPPWYTDVVGDVLLGVGVAGLAVGGTFFFLSTKSQSDADDATTYGDYEDAIEKAKSQRTIGIIGLAGGGAFVIGAVIKYATRGKRSPEGPAVSGWLDGQGGGGLTLFGRF